MQMTQKASFNCAAPAQALPSSWLHYRDAFAVVQHLCSLREAGIGSVSVARLREELALVDAEVPRILEQLAKLNFVSFTPTGRLVSITLRAIAYRDGQRGRRMSVRPA
jgi:DNA-binding IclR family transcriptional regulator